MNNAQFHPLPSLVSLREHLSYDPRTGDFTWIKRPYKANTIKVGQKAGGKNSGGYIVISFEGFKYGAHRLAWYMYHGIDPVDSFVDHKNRDTSDNSIGNLRLASVQENSSNQDANGFSYVPSKGKYHAYVRHLGQLHSLGHFLSPLQARAAYEAKKRELCGEFSPV